MGKKTNNQNYKRLNYNVQSQNWQQENATGDGHEYDLTNAERYEYLQLRVQKGEITQRQANLLFWGYKPAEQQ